MDFHNQLILINEKYYEAIEQKYGCFVKNFPSKGNLTSNVFPVSPSDCKDLFADLASHRAKCDHDGKIYIRTDKLNEHVLVHEFIHRLTNNRKYLGDFRFGVIQGFDADYSKHLFPYGNCDLLGLNELITEYLAFEITKYKEPTTYQQNLNVISEIRNRLGEDGFDNLIQSYFHSDVRSIWNILYKIYGGNMLYAMNHMTDVVCKSSYN